MTVRIPKKIYDSLCRFWGDTTDEYLARARLSIFLAENPGNDVLVLGRMRVVPDYLQYLDENGVIHYQTCLSVSIGKPMLLHEGGMPMVIENLDRSCVRLIGIREMEGIEVIIR